MTSGVTSATAKNKIQNKNKNTSWADEKKGMPTLVALQTEI